MPRRTMLFLRKYNIEVGFNNRLNGWATESTVTNYSGTTKRTASNSSMEHYQIMVSTYSMYM